MNSKIAERSSARVVQVFGEWWSSSSLVSVAKNVSATALSKHEPTAPIDCAMPASWQLWPKVSPIIALTAVVAMVNGPLGRPTCLDGHLQRLHHELLAHVGRHCPADDPARVEVLHRGQIQPALAGLDLLDVRRPHAVGGVGPEV